MNLKPLTQLGQVKKHPFKLYVKILHLLRGEYDL